MDFEYEIKRFMEILPGEITESRFRHSIRVAEYSELYAGVFRYSSPRKAYLAGLIHDITKQKQDRFHIELFEESGFQYTDLPHRSYHAFSAPFYLMKNFQFEENEIFSAISNHTLGRKNLPLLDKILYFCDYLGSDYFQKDPKKQEWIDQIQKSEFYGMNLKSSSTLKDLIEKNQEVHISTMETYNESIHFLK
ncbi:MAG: HD domain-containing protein [Leptospiraceae bacterium]|nr:HD domain-containing protein [Leptospiraceae bacterium]MCP5511242.1 HD domain-containing protein [Leptospiraceae bacterium]